MILAQLPNPQLQPLLYTKVTKYILHGPYGVNNPQAKYMVNEKYSKCFPKEYRERTDWAENSYLLYARSDNGLVFECNGPGSLINMWSLTVLNFFFFLIVISMLRSLLDWELSSI